MRSILLCNLLRNPETRVVKERRRRTLDISASLIVEVIVFKQTMTQKSAYQIEYIAEVRKKIPISDFNVWSKSLSTSPSSPQIRLLIVDVVQVIPYQKNSEQFWQILDTQITIQVVERMWTFLQERIERRTSEQRFNFPLSQISGHLTVSISWRSLWTSQHHKLQYAWSWSSFCRKSRSYETVVWRASKQIVDLLVSPIDRKTILVFLEAQSGKKSRGCCVSGGGGNGGHCPAMSHQSEKKHRLRTVSQEQVICESQSTLSWIQSIVHDRSQDPIILEYYETSATTLRGTQSLWRLKRQHDS